MIKLKFLFYFIIFYFSFINISNKIIIPFTIKRDFKVNYLNILFKQYCIIKINIGSQKQEMNLKIKLSNYYTSIAGKNCINIKNKFNELNSKTYININDETLYDLETINECKESQDNINILNTKIDNKNKSLEINNFPFLLVSILKESFNDDEGILGLSFLSHNQQDLNYNFINNLKRLKIINDYSFYFNFINTTYGELLLDQDFKKIFKNYITINIDLNNKIGYSFWNIGFKNIYFNGTILNKNEISTDYLFAEIEIENGLIIAPNFFKEFLFDKFFNNKICYTNYFYSNNYNKFDNPYEINYYYFYCDRTVNIKEFPDLNFELKYNKYNITFTYKDLFTEYDNKLFFLIIFGSNNWHFGKIFLEKYRVVFNQNKKIISLSLEKIRDKQNKKFKFNINYYLIIIFLLIIIIIAIIIIFIKLYPRRKRAFELDDNYDYILNKENYLEFTNNKNIIN